MICIHVGCFSRVILQREEVDVGPSSFKVSLERSGEADILVGEIT